MLSGYKSEARVLKPRVSRSKGRLSKRTTFVRDIVKEVAGYVLYYPMETGRICRMDYLEDYLMMHQRIMGLRVVR